MPAMQKFLDKVKGVDGARDIKPSGFSIKESGQDPLELSGAMQPTDIKITRSVTWSEGQAGESESGHAHPFYTFSGGTDTLDFSFMLDASENNDDLRDELEAIYDLAYPHHETSDGNKRAPLVKVVYGSFAFSGVITKVDFDVTLFDEKGQFKRASVTLSMDGYAFDGEKGKSTDEHFFGKPSEAPARDKSPVKPKGAEGEQESDLADTFGGISNPF